LAVVANAHVELVARMAAANTAPTALALRRMASSQLGRPATLQERAGEVLALKKKGLGVRAISLEPGVAVSSVHWVLTANTEKRERSRCEPGHLGVREHSQNG